MKRWKRILLWLILAAAYVVGSCWVYDLIENLSK
jgi:hypothetical protein